jgi:hypothetical protein
MKPNISARSKRYDEAIEAVASQSSNANDDMIHLKGEMQKLQDQVAGLTKQLNFVMTYFGLTEEAEQQTSNTRSYAATAARNIKGPIREAVLSAVHTEMQLKHSRSCNIVVTGLPYNPELSDEERFTALCYDEFGITPVMVTVKRLGREASGKLQPLLVVLQDEAQAQLLLSQAKLLRDSFDSYTANSIYISAHQTRAERQAAYEERCRRRRRQEAAARQEETRQATRPKAAAMRDSAGRRDTASLPTARPQLVDRGLATPEISGPCPVAPGPAATVVEPSAPAPILAPAAVAQTAQNLSLTADELSVLAKVLAASQRPTPSPAGPVGSSLRADAKTFSSSSLPGASAGAGPDSRSCP